MPTLRLIKAPPGINRSEMSYTLANDLIVMGRESTCEITIPDLKREVSRRHAQLEKINGKYFIKDLNSHNHTYLNNREVQSLTPLSDGDHIQIRPFAYIYHDERETGTKVPLPEGYKSPQKEECINDSELQVDLSVSTLVGTELLESQPSHRIRALLDISISLSATLEVEPLLNKIAEILLDMFKHADRCFVIMDESDVLIPRVVKTRRFRPDDDHRFSRSIIDRCFNTLEAYISDSASKSNTLADSIKINCIESVMCVPLLGSDGKAIGALQLDARDSSKRFREDDLKLLMIVANLCGLAIERANLYELKSQKEKQDYELRLARKIQLSFLPESTPVIPGYEFYSYYLAAQSIGGDYYDFIELPDGRVAVVVGDVAGKGVPAALLMAKLSSEARNCFQSTPNIERAIYVLNNRLTHVIGDRFVTLLAMVIDPNRHKATIVSAAHELFVLRDNKFCDVDCLTIRGLPLGTAPEIEYQSREIDLNIGETFLLFTDGLTDTPKEDKLLTLGLAKAISPLAVQGLMTTPKIVGERVIDIVTAHMNGREQADDIALICFGRPHPLVV